MFIKPSSILRMCLGAGLVLLGVFVPLLFLASENAATKWPQLAWLQWPVFLGVIAGFLPIVWVIRNSFLFLRQYDEDKVVTEYTWQLIVRSKLLMIIFASYMTVGFLTFWMVTERMPLTLMLTWVALVIVSVTVITALSMSATQIWLSLAADKDEYTETIPAVSPKSADEIRAEKTSRNEVTNDEALSVSCWY